MRRIVVAVLAFALLMLASRSTGQEITGPATVGEDEVKRYEVAIPEGVGRVLVFWDLPGPLSSFPADDNRTLYIDGPPGSYRLRANAIVGRSWDDARPVTLAMEVRIVPRDTPGPVPPTPIPTPTPTPQDPTFGDRVGRATEGLDAGGVARLSAGWSAGIDRARRDLPGLAATAPVALSVLFTATLEALGDAGEDDLRRVAILADLAALGAVDAATVLDRAGLILREMGRRGEGH